MNQQATVLIAQVEQKPVNTARGPSTLFIVKTSMGDMTTFDKDIALSANSLQGQQAQVEYQIAMNGTYENKYLKGILPAQVSPVVQAQQAQMHGAGQLAQGAAGIPQAAQRAAEPNVAKEISIQRQCATKVACTLNPASMAEFWANVTVLTDYYATGRVPTGVEQAMVQTFDAQQQPQQFSGDDDIPF